MDGGRGRNLGRRPRRQHPQQRARLPPVPTVDSSAGFRAEVHHRRDRRAPRCAANHRHRERRHPRLGHPGYDKSRDYVVQKLRAAGYAPVVHKFDFPFFKELAPSTLAQVSPDPTTYVNPDDFSTMTYSASGDVEAEVVKIDTAVTPTKRRPAGARSPTSPPSRVDAVALMQRGTCTFGVKVANAAEQAPPRRSSSTAARKATPGRSPARSARRRPSQPWCQLRPAQDLVDPAGDAVVPYQDTESEIRPTYNITAETAGGDSGNVVMAGAHLDSVVPGPGINDNGSGSSSILEVAEQMSALKLKPVNKVRFAWWGAEELNLLGSTTLRREPQGQQPRGARGIALYLNFDMVGSPNYVRFVYDGDNSTFPVGPGAAEGPPGSGQIEELFADYFAARAWPRTRRRSAAAATTARSSPRASRPVGCSPGPRAPRPRRRQRSTAGRPVSPTTTATTRPVTASAT